MFAYVGRDAPCRVAAIGKIVQVDEERQAIGKPVLASLHMITAHVPRCSSMFLSKSSHVLQMRKAWQGQPW